MFDTDGLIPASLGELKADAGIIATKLPPLKISATIPPILNPANAMWYYYSFPGDLPEEAQLEFRVAQDNNGNATNAIQGVETYLG